MNNQQFRRLLAETPTDRGSSPSGKDGSGATPRAGGVALGSKMRSSIPMTPRSVVGSTGIDFARQLAERNAATTSTSTTTFKSSAAPKGVKLPTGYVDRARERDAVIENEDDKASRVQALEDMVKLGQIEHATFVNLRDEITGGDVGSTHLVKGLDWKLLERVKRGEDVLKEAARGMERDTVKDTAEKAVDAEEELERLETQEVKPTQKENMMEDGEMGPPPPVMGQKRSRDAILAGLKASRQAAAAAKAAAQPTLGPKFRKMGEKQQAQSRIERDDRGREVLITTDEHGNVKRKVRRGDPTQPMTREKGSAGGLLMPDKDMAPLGMHVTTVAAPGVEEVEEVGDIFEEAGSDYDPLAGLDEEEDEEESSDDEGVVAENKKRDREEDDHERTTQSRSSSPPSKDPSMPPPPPPSSTTAHQPSARRDYFAATTPSTTNPASPESTPSSNPLQDASILSALRKASTLSNSLTSTSTPSSSSNPSLTERQKKLLAAQSRDDEDLDLGFGSSRFEDEVDAEEGGGKKVKLSVWDGKGGLGGGDDGGDNTGRGGGKERKRGKKKRKGDKESAKDVLAVLAGRRGKEGGKS
ncbi:MAG: hypothetical protein M1817_002089 [Caeruleum heppii]|nr:MAG: hypothetical protein M1817_002089 [Caeruleum heppii]